jgi:acyl carrier protein
MSGNAWPTRFEEVLRPHLVLVGDTPLTSDIGLAESGLDSLATVELLIELEEAFSVVVPDEQLGDAFDTVGGLWAILAGLRE